MSKTRDVKIFNNENDYEPIGFDPQCEYEINSVVGKVSMYADNLADDQPLDLFSTLVEHIRPQELTEHLKDILRKYPTLIAKLALNV